ncbi:DUF4255 domain-containing protein [Thioalkalicoccus limnaeus]|uniref:DUF4255 domain-containing protein n=1 Tax=Thioalkalicoccus limnaeus TaxID=120681 RepID=A0ABV4BID0_9GAMM
MPTANLYLVTQTLSRLLDLGVRNLLFRQGLATTLNVSTMPPERVGSVQNGLNLHLYHVMEDAHYRNAPPPGRGHPPVAREPLTLLLYYIMTAHHEINDVFDAEIQQRNFGLALKTFHDYPRIDDGLTIAPDANPPQTVMAPGLRGGDNQIEIALRPLTPEESLSFWSAEQSATTRLSAYYEVRTVFLEPEPPPGVAGTVLDLGVFVSVGRAPLLERVAALSHFSPPASTGLAPQTIETSPARASLAPGLVPPVNRVVVEGTRLAGDGTPGSAAIVLRNPAWREASPPIRSVPINPALNAAWAATLTERVASFEMQPSLIRDTETGPVTLDVVPGVYAVSILTTRRMETPSGRVRASQVESNQLAFTLGARIDGVAPADGFGRMGLQLVDLFDLTAATLEVQLAIDGIIYDEIPAFADDPVEDRGRYVREAGLLRLHPLFDPTRPGAHPVSLTINGAPSQPFWIETP